jgi:hypothetical protein
MLVHMVRWVAGGVLLLHGLGHGGALGALAWVHFQPLSDAGGWTAAQAWAVPAMTPDIATAIATTFWVVAMVGFVTVALAFWGIVVPTGWFRPVVVASAVVSIVGIVVFFGTWPLSNTLAALGVNAAVLVAVLWLRWSPPARSGS